MTKPLRIQFILADGVHARWVKRSENADDFATIRELKAHAHANGARDHGDDHDHAAFARQVAYAINAEVGAGHYDRLALIAPAHTLAAISQGLAPAARARLFRTLAKDLVQTPDHALADWLRPLEFG